MSAFAFVIIVALIITGGITLPITVGAVLKHLSKRRKLQGASDQRSHGEFERTVDDLSGRVARLEEERDFYKDLLESPVRLQQLRLGAMEEDVSDTGGPS